MVDLVFPRPRAEKEIQPAAEPSQSKENHNVPFAYSPLAGSRPSGHVFRRVDADACFQPSRGTISTHKPKFKPGKSCETHGSIAGERVGLSPRPGKRLVGQRQ